MTHPNIDPSDEVQHEAVTEFIIAEDWDTRFIANGAGMHALRSELDEATDPSEVIKLTEMRGEALVRTLGSAALSLFKRNVIVGRARFEADFGESQ